jgi:hypothetical protein
MQEQLVLKEAAAKVASAKVKHVQAKAVVRASMKTNVPWEGVELVMVIFSRIIVTVRYTVPPTGDLV